MIFLCPPPPPPPPQEGVLNRALDVGCAVGRSSFELAREYGEVVGLEYSHAFVAKCQELKMTGQSEYWLAGEGDLGAKKTAIVDPTIVSTNLTISISFFYHHLSFYPQPCYTGS